MINRETLYKICKSILIIVICLLLSTTVLVVEDVLYHGAVIYVMCQIIIFISGGIAGMRISDIWKSSGGVL